MNQYNMLSYICNWSPQILYNCRIWTIGDISGKEGKEGKDYPYLPKWLILILFPKMVGKDILTEIQKSLLKCNFVKY